MKINAYKQRLQILKLIIFVDYRFLSILYRSALSSNEKKCPALLSNTNFDLCRISTASKTVVEQLTDKWNYSHREVNKRVDAPFVCLRDASYSWNARLYRNRWAAPRPRATPSPSDVGGAHPRGNNAIGSRLRCRPGPNQIIRDVYTSANPRLFQKSLAPTSQIRATYRRALIEKCTSCTESFSLHSRCRQKRFWRLIQSERPFLW